MRIAWPLLLLVVACGALAQDALDETAQWNVVGDATLEKMDGPGPIEGKTALKCTVDETKRGYMYFRFTPPTSDLTQVEKLRFRLYGGLKNSEVHELVLHDNGQRFAKWQHKNLVACSQDPRWREVEVYLDSPFEDWNTDRKNVTSITWRIHSPGGGQSSSFLLDGVRLVPREAEDIPGPAEVVLEQGGYQAVFTKDSRFELAHFRTPDGGTIPVRTSMHMRGVIAPTPEGEVLSLGGKWNWKKVDATAERLHIAYERGDFLNEITFAWQGGALAIQRRATCLRKGVGELFSKISVVWFDEPLQNYLFDRGVQESTGELPLKSTLLPPGNWAAAYAKDGPGAAVIFPQRPLFRCALVGTRFDVMDAGNLGRYELWPGAQLGYDLWIAPLKIGSAAEQSRAAAQAVCAALCQENDPTRFCFFPAYQPHKPESFLLAGDDRLTLWQASSDATINEMQPPPTERAEGVKLFLARGETEPLHLVISAKAPMKNLSVKCSELRCGENTIPADRFRVRYAGYVRIRPTTEHERDQQPELKKKGRTIDCWQFVGEIDKGSEFLTTDRLYGGDAAALGPVEDPLYDAPSVDVVPGRNQPIWITLSAPSDAQPGTYKGNIELIADGRRLAAIPMTATVWKFAVPKVTSLRTWYQLWNHAEVAPHWKGYYRDLAEHKVSGFGGMPGSTPEDGKSIATGPSVRLENGKIVVDWTRFDQVAAFLLDELGMRHAKLPEGKRGGGHVHVYDFLGLKEGTPEFEKAWYDFLCRAREHLKEKGWLDGLDCYIFDEPDKERIEVIRRTAPIIRKAIPEILVFAACTHNTLSLVGALNAWCPAMDHVGIPAGDFSWKRIEEGRKRGDAYLWYNLNNDDIGSPIISHRALPWATWKAGLDGYFVWSINYWGSKAAPYATMYPIGNANYIYPGKGGPVDSLRWEMAREGLEDFDYLVILEKALAEGKAPTPIADRGKAALDRARALFPDPRRMIGVSPRELREIRDEIGQLLDALAK
ncbi:MAG: glycoside hydrolase domain-containing protein [Planctomycetota bacterium]